MRQGILLGHFLCDRVQGVERFAAHPVISLVKYPPPRAFICVNVVCSTAAQFLRHIYPIFVIILAHILDFGTLLAFKSFFAISTLVLALINDIWVLLLGLLEFSAIFRTSFVSFKPVSGIRLLVLKVLFCTTFQHSFFHLSSLAFGLLLTIVY